MNRWFFFYFSFSFFWFVCLLFLSFFVYSSTLKVFLTWTLFYEGNPYFTTFKNWGIQSFLFFVYFFVLFTFLHLWFATFFSFFSLVSFFVLSLPSHISNPIRNILPSNPRRIIKQNYCCWCWNVISITKSSKSFRSSWIPNIES